MRPAGSDYQVNAAVEIFVGDSAHVDHVKIPSARARTRCMSPRSPPRSAPKRALIPSRSPPAAPWCATPAVPQDFDGEDTVAGIRGATLIKEAGSTPDTTLVADHVARSGCQSREVFKSVLDGEAHGVFQGRIIVRPHAQKTDAKMMTRALLLSERAEADNKPELEIFADDVQCGHGATAGALDDELKFYLMARGIPRPEAEALLIRAFLGEAIDGIEHAGLREALMDAVAAWLKAR